MKTRARLGPFLVGLFLTGPVVLTATAGGPACVPAESGIILPPEDIASAGFFGYDMAASGDRVVISAINEPVNIGSCFVHRRVANGWIEEERLTASAPNQPMLGLGYAVAMDATRVWAGAPFLTDPDFGRGAVFEFTRSDEQGWAQTDILFGSDGAGGDLFGFSVAYELPWLVVGAPRNAANGPDAGAVYIFRREGSAWIEDDVLRPDPGTERFGTAVDLTNGRLFIGAPGDSFDGNWGTVSLYEHLAGDWTRTLYLHRPDEPDSSGFGAVLDADGNRLIVGMPSDDAVEPDGGAAYTFIREGGTWRTEQKLLGPGVGSCCDAFGSQVAVFGDRAFIRARGDLPQKGLLDPGVVYVYDRVAGMWSSSMTIRAASAATGDFFGQSFAVTDADLLVGAYRRGDIVPLGGAVMTFDRCPCPADIAPPHNGTVDFDDLSALLACWGPLTAGCEGADFVSEGMSEHIIDFEDLAMLLMMWGPCPS